LNTIHFKEKLRLKAVYSLFLLADIDHFYILLIALGKKFKEEALLQ
jgi:hypothetical protein